MGSTRQKIHRATGFSLLAVLVLFSLIAFLRHSSVGSRSETSPTPDLESLKSVPYIQWTESTNPQLRGVTRWNRDRSYPGYNLYTNDVNRVYLIDMRGHKIHQWVVPEKKHCEHAELLDNGDVIVVCASEGIVKLDWNSKVIWKNSIPVHHDVEIMPDNSLISILKMPPQHYRTYMVDFDSLVYMSPTGVTTGTWSTFQNLAKLKQFHKPSPLDIPNNPAAHVQAVENTRYDYYHVNTVESIPENSLHKNDKRFRPGNLLVCFRNTNLIAILHSVTKQVLWSWGIDQLDYPHMPTMLPNGNILVFDNGTHRKYSRVLEIDPLTKKIVWKYEGNPRESFFSPWRGSNQRLANGNTLICDSENGRAFEIDRKGRTVWEFWSPDIQGDKRKRIYRFNRIERQEVLRFWRKPSLKRKVVPTSQGR